MVRIKKNRNANIELLRIIAILLIMSQHLIERGTGDSSYAILQLPISWRFFIASLFGNWGQLGVVLFVMITSWFMVDRKGIKFIRFIEITLQSWIVSVLFLVFFILYDSKVISREIFCTEFFTPIKQQYWFVSAFLVFYLMIPLLQKVTNSLTPETAKFLWLLFTPLVPIYNYYQQNVGGYLMDFIYIFLFIAYLKSNKNNWFERNRNYFFIGIIVIIGLEMIAKIYLPPERFIDIYIKIRGRTLITIITAAMIFYCFLKMEVKQKKLIYWGGKASFGIYLLHENVLFRPLWRKIFYVDSWYFSSNVYVILHPILIVFLFLILIPISLWITNLVNKITMKLFKNISKKVDGLFNVILKNN